MNRSTRVSPVRRTLAAAAVTTLLATGLAACGDKSGDAAPAGSTSSGTTSTASPSAGQADVAPVGALKPGGTVSPADFAATMKAGLAASTTAHTTMSMDVGAMGKLTGSGEIDLTKDPAEMALTMTMPGGGSGTMDVRVVDGMFYLSMGQLTGGKFWKVDPKDPTGPLGSSGLGSMLDQMAPGRMLVDAQDSIHDVTYVGQEQVAGRRLDHYRLSVETAGMVHAMGEAMRGRGGPAAGSLPKTLHYNLWLDDQHRLGQMVMDVPVGGNPISMRMEMTDWGSPVHIAAPSADQVTDPSRISG